MRGAGGKTDTPSEKNFACESPVNKWILMISLRNAADGLGNQSGLHQKIV